MSAKMYQAMPVFYKKEKIMFVSLLNNNTSFIYICIEK